MMEVVINGTYNVSGYHNVSWLENIEYGGYSDAEKQHLQMYTLFVFIVGSLIIVTNLIVVISSGLIIKTAQQPKSAYLQLGNASLAHMLIGAAAIFDIGLPKTYTSHTLCVIQIGMIVSGTITSIYSAGLIAVDRFIYILYSHNHKKWATTKKVRLSIVLVWILGIVPAYMPLTGWAGDTKNGLKCWYIKLSPPPLIVITSVICILPVVVVCVLYSIILYNALKMVNQLKNASRTGLQETDKDNSKLRVFRGRNSNFSNSSSDQSVNTIVTSVSTDIHYTQNEFQSPIKSKEPVNGSSSKKNKSKVIYVIPKLKQPTKWKAVKVVLFTMGSIACTWVPYFIASLIYVSCMHEEDQTNCRAVEVALASPLAILGLVNSFVNPVVYAWWHKGFTGSLKKMLLKRIKICKINSSDPRQPSIQSQQVSL